MSKGGNKQPSIDAAEHIGVDDTGDNIEAKRVASYVWNGSAWTRDTGSGGGGGGTQYAEGATTSPATGTVALGRYLASAPGTLADGAFSAPLLDSFGQLKVVPVGTVAISAVSLPLPTGASTSANQNTGNTSLATIATNTTGVATAANQATMAANQTNRTQLTKVTDGTNDASVVAGDSGFNGVGTMSATKTLTFTTSTPGAQILLENTDVRGYSWVEVVYTSVGSGLALTAQFSTASGGTYVNSSTFGSSANGSGGAIGSTVGTIYFSPIHGNFFHLNLTALTSGTFTGTVTLRAIPPANNTISANQVGTWTVQPGNTANSTAWLMAGGKTNNNAAPGATNLGVLGVVANATSPTWTEGNLAALSSDLKGYTRVNAGLMPLATELVTYSVRLTTNTTTTPVSATVYISSITLSSEVGGTTSTLTIQDKQGTPLKLVNGFTTVAVTTTPTVINFQTPVKMTSGIDVISAGAVAATVDVWINYYQ